MHALVQAETTTPGTADSFLRVALYILQHRAYDRYCLRETEDAEDLPEFEGWCHQREDTPQFQYWATVLEQEVLVVVYMRSLQQASFTMYLEALMEPAPWFHALDRINYARWIGSMP